MFSHPSLDSTVVAGTLMHRVPVGSVSGGSGSSVSLTVSSKDCEWVDDILSDMGLQRHPLPLSSIVPTCSVTVRYRLGVVSLSQCVDRIRPSLVLENTRELYALDMLARCYPQISVGQLRLSPSVGLVNFASIPEDNVKAVRFKDFLCDLLCRDDGGNTKGSHSLGDVSSGDGVGGIGSSGAALSRLNILVVSVTAELLCTSPTAASGNPQLGGALSRYFINRPAEQIGEVIYEGQHLGACGEIVDASYSGDAMKANAVSSASAGAIISETCVVRGIRKIIGHRRYLLSVGHGGADQVCALVHDCDVSSGPLFMQFLKAFDDARYKQSDTIPTQSISENIGGRFSVCDLSVYGFFSSASMRIVKSEVVRRVATRPCFPDRASWDNVDIRGYGRTLSEFEAGMRLYTCCGWASLACNGAGVKHDVYLARPRGPLTFEAGHSGTATFKDQPGDLSIHAFVCRHLNIAGESGLRARLLALSPASLVLESAQQSLRNLGVISETASVHYVVPTQVPAIEEVIGSHEEALAEAKEAGKYADEADRVLELLMPSMFPDSGLPEVERLRARDNARAVAADLHAREVERLRARDNARAIAAHLHAKAQRRAQCCTVS